MHRLQNKSIGSRMRTRRTQLGITLEALAEKVRISKSTLQRIENGTADPILSDVPKLSVALKCTGKYLLGEEDTPNYEEYAFVNEILDRIILLTPVYRKCVMQIVDTLVDHIRNQERWESIK